MFFVGLTGGIATGKSTVSSFFIDLGCAVIDADTIAREVVAPGTRAWTSIVKEFGSDILLDDGELNRKKLRQLIFADAAKRKKLNSITHPKIGMAILWKLLWLLFQGERFVIMDIPLLFESQSFISRMFIKHTIVVSCDQETQISRLMKRDSVSREEAKLSIKAQMPLAEKCKLATYIINNSTSKEKCLQQVRQLHNTFTCSKAFLPLRLGLFCIAVFAVGSMTYLVLSISR